MQDDFEKQVREKMGELNFSPSDPLWPAIELQIRKKKERRRALIWFCGLLLAGGLAAWWWLPSLSTDQRGEALRSSQPPSGSSRSGDPEPVVIEPLYPPVTPQPSLPPAPSTRPPAPAGNQPEQDPVREYFPLQTDSIQTSIQLENVRQPLNQGEETARPYQQPKETRPPGDSLTFQTATQEPARPSLPSSTDTASAKESNKPDSPVVKVVQTADPAPLSDSTLRPTAAKKLPKWSPRLQLDLGLSEVGQGLPSFAKSVQGDVFSPALPPFNQARYNPSPTKPGLAFALGYSWQRQTGKRVSYSIGLRYQYLSNRFEVGRYGRRDTVVPTAGLSTIRVGEFFIHPRQSSDPDRNQLNHNQYHFLSLPLSLEWQVLPNKRLQATAGLSMRYLVASRALLYSYGTNLYYYDPKALNRLQTFSDFSLRYTFFQKSRLPVAIGPYLNYSWSRLEKERPSNLFSAGLSSSIPLFKKTSSH